MKKPEMILFDYGHTLCYEGDFDGLRGTEAVMKYAVKNPRGLTAAQVQAFVTELNGKIGRYRRENGREMTLEVHQHMFQRLLYESLEIEFSLSPVACEEIFWDFAAPGSVMPGATALLNALSRHHIRSGVISNIGFSGEALKNRLNRLLPQNCFEFVIASSEYVFRKPERLLFALALVKAQLPADRVWFCGDDVAADIMGASAAGIFPVWYESGLDCFYRSKKEQLRPVCPHLHIRDWQELTDILSQL